MKRSKILIALVCCLLGLPLASCRSTSAAGEASADSLARPEVLVADEDGTPLALGLRSPGGDLSDLVLLDLKGRVRLTGRFDSQGRCTGTWLLLDEAGHIDWESTSGLICIDTVLCILPAGYPDYMGSVSSSPACIAAIRDLYPRESDSGWDGSGYYERGVRTWPNEQQRKETDFARLQSALQLLDLAESGWPLRLHSTAPQATAPSQP